MKKVLFASTALVASAGIAAAEVSLSGSAAMGIFGGDNVETQFVTDIDVTFTMSGSTDNGLTFGASIDLDEGGNGQPFENPFLQGGETIFVSGQFGTLTMGDTDGALDWALSEAIIGGSLTDVHEHFGYNGNNGTDGEFFDGQVARYDYSFGDFAVALSAEIDDAGAPLSDTAFGLGVKYSTDFAGADLALGLGYQTATSAAGLDIDFLGVSADVSLDSGLRFIASYMQGDTNVAGVDPRHYGVALGYSMDALTVAINYGEYEDWAALGNPDGNGLGLIVNYDLGGGAVLQAGYASNDPDVGASFDRYSFGLSMSF